MKILLLSLVMIGMAMKGYCNEDHDIGDSACPEVCTDIDPGEHCDEKEKKCKCGHRKSCIDTDKPICIKGVCQSCKKPNILCKSKGHNVCVLADFICDDSYECEDGEDEKHCVHEGTDKECYGNQFACGAIGSNHKECIEGANVCDGKEDCPDGSDEMTEDCEELPGSGVKRGGGGSGIISVITVLSMTMIM